MKASARNSGHFVQGHVDGVGTIVKKWVEGDSLWIRVSAPSAITRYLVPKGYVAVDGTSLTVCDVNVAEGWFTFMLVEYTQKHIVVPLKSDDGTGKVNIEVDVLGKYVERSMRSMLERRWPRWKKYLDWMVDRQRMWMGCLADGQVAMEVLTKCPPCLQRLSPREWTLLRQQCQAE